MSDTTTSTNMNLPIPVVGVDNGPDWASNLNACLTLIDQHDHSAGFGVPISPDGISINSDLPFNNNNLTLARSIRFKSQSAALALAADLGCLYEVGVDLYYNDGSGNQIRITQSGGIAGTPGSIANLSSPASAAYVAADSTFVWQSAAATPAYMDAASIILRNLSANSKGLTLNPPAAMGANFVLTLPTLPASTKIMQLDSSGSMSATLTVDNTTIEIATQALQVKNLGITTAKISAGAVTRPKITPATPVTSTITVGGGIFSRTSAVIGTVTGLVNTIITDGGPVMLILQSDGSNINSSISTAGSATVSIDRGGTTIAYSRYQGPGTTIQFGSSLVFMDYSVVGTPGTYVYTIQAAGDGTNQMSVSHMRFVSYEMA